FADLAVGASTVSDEGAVYVYFGGFEGPGAAPDMVVPSPAGQGGNFGASVAWAGDVDGDGYCDLLIGAPESNDSAGSAYVVPGSSEGPRPTLTTLIAGNSPGPVVEYFGWHVAGAGDVNADGYDDVVVGAPADRSAGGRIYLFAGSTTSVNPMPAAPLTGGLGADDGFGLALAGAGDVDRNGAADLTCGAPQTSSASGKAFLYYGDGTGLDEVRSFTLSGGESAGGRFGAAVAR